MAKKKHGIIPGRPGDGIGVSEHLIRGIIGPAEWDNDFNVVALMILTNEEEELYVESDEKGRELFKHIREPVELTGTVETDGKGRKVVKVSDYTIPE